MYELLYGSFRELSCSSAMNSTTHPLAFVICNTACLPPIIIPFYIFLRQRLFDNIPDTYVALAAPLLTFWFMSCPTVLVVLSGDGSINIAYASPRKSSPETWQWLGKNAGLGCATSLWGGDGEENTGAVEA
ncbi:hypothetical protein CY34DRAFT_806327 [Suillus luteus UH-Slu-Lm8-n1]|uniref:Uncharacterized protein n=1 Tax=Suillus luteus UH-Slu-Lm8-n1 TaxID=930992 RepID=A0A0D0BCS8_9AGAM|nr:hypothetical protein CY34DRAFT_806327 [Suillus luteus UH-Slu-Lm8-n1]